MVVHPPKKFRKYGDQFTLLSAANGAFIYKRSHGTQTYYEVFKARIRRSGDSKLIKNKYSRYRYPCDEDFGNTAFCYRHHSRAYTKYLELCQRQ